MIELTAKQRQQIKEYTLKCYPEEMCGVLVAEEFVPLSNVSDNPENEFRILEQDLIPYLGNIIAVVHSHCYDAKKPTLFDVRTPSAADVRQQKISKVPWLIVGTEGKVVMPPLQLPRVPSNKYEGRPFIWFINDCYTLVQDYYRYELDILLPDHKADVNYKELRNHNKLFEKYIKEYKFKEVNGIDDMKNGDLLLLNNGIAVENHLGLYHNGDVFSQDAISNKLPFYAFVGRINKVLRYDNLPQE